MKKFKLLASVSILFIANGVMAQNVGIGTPTPTEKIHVLGGARITSLGGVGNALVLSNNTGVLSTTALSGNPTDVFTGTGVWTPISSLDADWQVAGNDMYSLPTGNVGIGLIAPTYKFQVVANSAGSASAYFSQTNTTAGSHGAKGEGVFGPTRGYLGIQGANAFDGTTWNIAGEEIGVLGISEGGSTTDNSGVMGLSNGIGVYGESTISTGVYGSSNTGNGVFGFSTTSNGAYGQTAAANAFGVFGYNANASGTGVIGTGNNVGGQYLVTGSGGAFTGDDGGVVARARTVASGTGVIASGNNLGWITLITGSGVAGNGVNGVYGRSESATGAGIVGQNTTTGWTGDFQGPMKAGLNTTDRHDFWGWWQSGSNSDNHRVNPNSGNWGYVGDPTNYWWHMYSNNFINVSRRELKREIQPISDDQMLEAVIMYDLDRIEPSFYKYKCETDIIEKGNEAKFRGNMHLGVIVDESPDYLQDNALSGIDVYSIGVMGVAAAKQNRKEIKVLKKNINDFGVDEINGTEVFVSFNDEFATTRKNGTPVVTLTAFNSDVRLFITSITETGFTVKSNAASATQFNWIAMAKADLTSEISLSEIEAYKKANSLTVPASDKQAIKDWVEADANFSKEINDRTPPSVLSQPVSQNSSEILLEEGGSGVIESKTIVKKPVQEK